MPLLGLRIAFLFILLCGLLQESRSSISPIEALAAASKDRDPGNRCCLRDASETPVAKSPMKPKNMAFLIGAQKSGTTFLFDELVKRHPNFLSRTVKTSQRTGINDEKEAQYFNMLPLPDANEYITGFSNSGNPLNESLTFLDGTPDYMHTPSAACRVAGAFPDSKLVVLLRDPVARALSHWNMWRVLGGKRRFADEVYEELGVMRARKCSFEPDLEGVARRLAISDPTARDARTWQRDASIPSWNSCFRCSFGRCGMLQKAGDSTVCRQVYPIQGIVRRGMYVYQLEWWLRFFPPEQFLILHHEQLLRDPETVIHKVVKFLGQDPALLAPSQAADGQSNQIKGLGSSVSKGFKNKTASGWSLPLRDKNATVVYADAIKTLYSFYAHANQELYAMLKEVDVASGWVGKFASAPKKRRPEGA